MANKSRPITARFSKYNHGATGIGYGLQIGLVAVVVIAALTASGDTIRSLFSNVGGKLDEATTGGSPAASPGAACTGAGSQVFAYTGATQSFVVDSNIDAGCTTLVARVWGAGGGGGGSEATVGAQDGGSGGAGGYAHVALDLDGLRGQTLTVIVGGGGGRGDDDGEPLDFGDPIPGDSSHTIGQGGFAGGQTNCPGAGSAYNGSAGGGGYSGLFTSSSLSFNPAYNATPADPLANTIVIAAGGGGGSGRIGEGGAGGGDSGENGNEGANAPGVAGGGATSSSFGAAGAGDANDTLAGHFFRGGCSGNQGGGGGGGYRGGGGGDTVNGDDGGGGGGAGIDNPVFVTSSISISGGSGKSPASAATSDSFYAPNSGGISNVREAVAVGGTGSVDGTTTSGGHGMVVLEWQ